MANGLKEIIGQLERQRSAIEKALAALRDVEGAAGASTEAASGGGRPAATKKAARKGGMTPEGRARLSEALRQRWAAKRAAAANGGTAKTATKKRGRPAKAR